MSFTRLTDLNRVLNRAARAVAVMYAAVAVLCAVQAVPLFRSGDGAGWPWLVAALGWSLGGGMWAASSFRTGAGR
ncbi:hypothetical protein [Streptomyces sp. CAU 1734]|uniref:hypothetical protein n=1 Tax=Streptomyces sp. CAU 1734 TaxID=3140360 RepID=UPI0032618ED5